LVNNFTLESGSDISGATVKLDGKGGKDVFNLSANISSSNANNILGDDGDDTFNIKAPGLSGQS